MNTNKMNQLLTDCDALLGAMDFDLGKATERQAVKDYTAAQHFISAAHSKLGGAGAALAACAKELNGSGPGPTPEPVDPPYHGNINPLSLGPYDLAFYQYANLAHKVDTIFSGNRTTLNQWIGRDYEASKAYDNPARAAYTGILKQFQ